MPRQLALLPFALMALGLATCSDSPSTGSADAATDSSTDLADARPDSDAQPDADAEPDTRVADNPFADVPETARYELDCLDAPVHVVRTEHDFPHIFAQSATDLQCAHGFVVARDRYVVMELARRLGLSQLSEIIGEPGLALDIENRSWGIERLADGLYAGLLDSPHHNEAVAYAAGVTAYVDHAVRGDLPLPPLFELIYIVLGVSGPEDLLSPWDDRAIAGAGATLIWQAGFDGNDVARELALSDALEWGSGLPDAELRREGLIDDLLLSVRPVHARRSAADWSSPDQKRGALALPPALHNLGPAVERGLLERSSRRLRGIAERRGRNLAAGFGSNAWAVTAGATADGRALLASDGHLSLTTPTTFYNLHLDDALLGGGDTHVIGTTFPGIPVVVVGTNGQVAWSQTQFLGDLTDWYREELVVENGRPAARMVDGNAEDLVVIEETYEVSRALGSRAGTRTYERFETADGRPIFGVEGTVVDGPDDDLGAINIGGDWIVAGDVDDDGVVTGISVAYVGHFERAALNTYRGFGHSASVAELAQHHARSAALGANLHAADLAGDVLYSGFQAVSCRRYLERDGSGHPVAGADPTFLIDGSRFTSFQVTREDDGTIATASDDDRDCTLSYEAFPHAISPAQGYVFNGNNDPFGGTFDGDLFNDALYIGGLDWASGYRARRMDELLAAQVGSHSMATMVAMQNDHQAPLARDLSAELLPALAAAESAFDAGATEGVAGRLAMLWQQDADALEEARGRLQDWADRDYPATSGVATFYHEPVDGEGGDAVATMIFHAWLTALHAAIFEDEAIPESVDVTTDADRFLYWLLEGRGPDNPAQLTSWSESTEESVFFDVVGTDPVESSEEVIVAALLDALASLSAPDQGDGSGGFGTDDQSRWLWGLKHMVRFPSIISTYIGDSEPTLATLLAGFGLTTDDIPLTDTPLDEADPRASLTGFPRPGAPRSLDVAGEPVNPTGDYSYAHGPIFRMVVALGPEGPEGVNVLPGGQSDDPDSDFYGDQAALWLGNQTFPLRYHPEDITAGAVGRELLLPTGQ